MGNNINLDANTLGARITIAIVILGLVLEVLSDNFTWQSQGIPMTIEACSNLCASQNEPVARVEAWACECRPADRCSS